MRVCARACSNYQELAETPTLNLAVGSLRPIAYQQPPQEIFSVSEAGRLSSEPEQFHLPPLHVWGRFFDSRGSLDYTDYIIRFHAPLPMETAAA
jgi:hypothetical protein